VGWAATGNNIYNTNSGNVGIGTTSPLLPLHVVGVETSYSCTILGGSHTFTATGTGATGTIQTYTVPSTGTYTIEVWGAQGGGGGYGGGLGARMRGDVALTAGTVLKILVGQQGGATYGGGGGGSFVTKSDNSPLVIAGGGNTYSAWSSTAAPGVTGTSGTGGTNGTGGSGGGGGSGYNGSPGGAGLIGNGGASTCANAVAPLSFINGGTGGATCNSIGGFGGGSGSDGCCWGQSGPGGGYSGGGASSGGGVYGGGGGSYNNGTNQSNTEGVRSGNGQVVITWEVTTTCTRVDSAYFGGNVGIGTTSPAYQLQLSTNSAAKPTSTAWTVPSDIRIKKDISPFTDGLNVIDKINPVNYRLNGKAGLPMDAPGIGVIAQEVKDIIPYTIKTWKAKLNPTDKEETVLYDFDASPMTFVLINAVKEQQKQIEELAGEIRELKDKH
jgi:hypothetical protein